MKVLTLCGSLRAASLNAALLRTVARVSPPEVDVLACTGVGELPVFNPALYERRPDTVDHVFNQIAWADALMIASPAYAHTLNGVIRNLLEWLTTFEPFQHMPVAVLNASPRSGQASMALKIALRSMSADVVQAACIHIPRPDERMTELQMVRQPVIVHPLQTALRVLQSHLAARRPASERHGARAMAP